ncbi:MAG: Nif3-like dinuclear metal center hexameric protein [Candidatus Hodarchaeota archaeon]
MATLSDILRTVETLAPKTLAFSDDPVGVQVGITDPSEQARITVKKCVVSLDPTVKVILEALQAKASLIITHHPLSLSLAKNVSDELLKKIELLGAKRSTLFCVHTNWTSAENGITDTLIDILGLKKLDVFQPSYGNQQIPLGRICQPLSEGMPLEFFLEQMAHKLNLKAIDYVGKPDSSVNRICIVCGSGGKYEWIKEAKYLGINTYLTGEASHDCARLAEELKINLINATRYATENPGMRRLLQLLQLEHSDVDFIFIDSNQPWKISLRG